MKFPKAGSIPLVTSVLKEKKKKNKKRYKMKVDQKLEPKPKNRAQTLGQCLKRLLSLEAHAEECNGVVHGPPLVHQN